MTQHFSRIVALSFVLTACGTESPSPQPSVAPSTPQTLSITVSSAASGAMVQRWVAKTTLSDPIAAIDYDYEIYSDGYIRNSSSGFYAAALTDLVAGTYPLYFASLKMGDTKWTLAPAGGSMTLEPIQGYKYRYSGVALEATFVDEGGVSEPVVVRVTHGP